PNSLTLGFFLPFPGFPPPLVGVVPAVLLPGLVVPVAGLVGCRAVVPPSLPAAGADAACAGVPAPAAAPDGPAAPGGAGGCPGTRGWSPAGRPVFGSIAPTGTIP